MGKKRGSYNNSTVSDQDASLSTSKRNPVLIFATLLISNVLIFLLLLILLEGVASWYHFFRTLHSIGGVAEELYTEYDPDIGWINKKSFTVKDMYGPGNTLTTLENRTRRTGSEDTAGSLSVICSGDSFTLGYGVDDVEGWCSLLRNRGWKVTNMGQGGYGIDQSYLWYQRDAQVIPHQLHLLASNIYDFDRAYSSTFVGYDKPFFIPVDGEVKNVKNPVPSFSPWKRFLVKNRPALEGLHAFRALQQVNTSGADNTAPATQRQVSDYLIKQMYQLSAERGAQFAYVLLPTVSDQAERQSYNGMKELVEGFAQTYHFPVVDVGAEMFTLEPEKYQSLFIKEGVMSYNGSQGHYTEEGNQVVADIIFAQVERFRTASLPSATGIASQSGTPLPLNVR